MFHYIKNINVYEKIIYSREELIKVTYIKNSGHKKKNKKKQQQKNNMGKMRYIHILFIYSLLKSQ